MLLGYLGILADRLLTELNSAMLTSAECVAQPMSAMHLAKVQLLAPALRILSLYLSNPLALKHYAKVGYLDTIETHRFGLVSYVLDWMQPFFVIGIWSVTFENYVFIIAFSIVDLL